MISRVEKDKKQPNLRWDPSVSKWIGYRVDVRSGRRRHRPTFPTKKQAEDFIAELRTKRVYARAGLQRPVASEIRISTLFEKHRPKLRNPKEQVRAKRVFEIFASVVGVDVHVTEIRKFHFQDFINRRYNDGVKPESIDRELNILSAAFKQAADHFPQELQNYEPPAIARPKYRKRKTTKRDIKEFEKEAILRSILNDRLKREQPQRTQARPIVALMFELAWLIGLRYSEILALRKEEFSPPNRILYARREKTGDITIFEHLPDRVLQLLQTAIEHNPAGPFIFSLPCSSHTFSDIMKAAVLANGIAYGRDLIGGVTFHSTRHSFTTRIVQVTDIATAKSFTGHSDAEMVAYYSHASDESRRQAMHRLYGAADRGREARKIFNGIKAGKVSFEEFCSLFSAFKN